MGSRSLHFSKAVISTVCTPPNISTHVQLDFEHPKTAKSKKKVKMIGARFIGNRFFVG
jgi:hypothetical protein